MKKKRMGYDILKWMKGPMQSTPNADDISWAITEMNRHKERNRTKKI